MNPTYPHDYRVLFNGEVKPGVIGGQAVNLWAITYLETGDPSLAAKRYSSGDMDFLDEGKVLDFLRKSPGWSFIERTVRDPFDVRVGSAVATSDDNRKLLVEVVKGVKGLDAEDIVWAKLEHLGTTYRLLDPIALLKAKATNLRELDQKGPPPRHDREHLGLIVQCIPLFIKSILAQPEAEEKAPKTISRLFSTLQHKKTAETLRSEGVDILALITDDIKNSPIAKIRRACENQIPRLMDSEDTAMTAFCERSGNELKEIGSKHELLLPGNRRLPLVERAAKHHHGAAEELLAVIEHARTDYGGGNPPSGAGGSPPGDKT